MRRVLSYSSILFLLFLIIIQLSHAFGQSGFGECTSPGTVLAKACIVRESKMVQGSFTAKKRTRNVTSHSGSDSPGYTPSPSQNIKSLSEKFTLQPAQTTSGFVDDEIFGTYEGHNLDQYLFRPQGRIRFPIYITRVYSKNKQDYDELVVDQPQLVLRVWDVDANCSGACNGCCEVDNVYINDQLIGILDGANESWSTVRFDIPVEWFQDGTIRDATYNGPGLKPTPGENWIEIDINTTGCTLGEDTPLGCWAVLADYGEIQAKGMRPAALFHGMNLSLMPGGSPRSWNVFRTYIPGDHSEAYQLDGNGAVAVNARAVQEFIDQTLIGFGVQKINIIAHSKGGLDSSQAIVGYGTNIDNIITLGSPLLGTEYADHMYGNHRWFFPRSDEVALNDLHTVTREAYYNTRNNAEPGVKYHYFAGNRFEDTDSECPFPFDGTLIFSVDNDTYVPVNRTFPKWRSIADRIAPYEHSEMLSQQDVGEWAVQLMRDSVTGLSASFIIARQSGHQRIDIPGKLAETASPNPQYTFAISDSLTLDESKTYQAPIDSSVAKGQFFITYPAEADFDLVLVDPNGSKHDIPDFKGSFVPEGIAGVFYEISNPFFGLWLIEIHANTDGEIQGGVELSATLILDSLTDKGSYASGEPISLTATLTKDGNPLAGANVVAHLSTLSGFSDNAVLTDNGDGTYSVSYIPPTGGYFTVKIAAESLTGESFQREKNVFVTVSPPTANIVEVASESTNDADGNGLYNNLILEISLQVQIEGDYSIIGGLADAAGILIANAASSLHLLPGSHNISLVFDGRTIHDSGRNGPYNLSQLTIHDLSQQGLIADAKTDAYLTASYNFYDFEGPVLTFGSGRDFGTDSDGDSFYNTLIIELEISVNPGYEGPYTFNAELQDLNGTGIEWYSNPEQNLDIGLNTIQLIYSGEAITAAELDGPYRVGNFHLFNLDDPTVQLSSPNAYTSTAYLVCQFQGADRCDANCDGIVNLRDAVDLLKFLISRGDPFMHPNPDCNDDGEVNFSDVIAIIKEVGESR